MARVVFRGSVRGAGASARALGKLARGLQDDIVAELRWLAARAERTFYSHAPKDTGEMAESIHARFSFRTRRPRFHIEVDAERDGFDYLPVTRFGHGGTIRADPSRAEGTGQRAPALAIFSQGRRDEPIFRASAAGYDPSTDWVADARFSLDRDADTAQKRLGRRIDRRTIR